MGLGSLEPMAHGAIRPRAPCATTPELTEVDGKVALTKPAVVDVESLDATNRVKSRRIFCARFGVSVTIEVSKNVFVAQPAALVGMTLK